MFRNKIPTSISICGRCTYNITYIHCTCDHSHVIIWLVTLQIFKILIISWLQYHVYWYNKAKHKTYNLWTHYFCWCTHTFGKSSPSVWHRRDVEMKLWCFRPLLCTLFRLNWAKQTPGIMWRNYGARLRYRNECVHYSSRHIFRIVFCDKFQSGLSLHISYTPPIYVVSEPALSEEIINQAIEGPSNSSIQPVTSFRPILRQQ